MKWEQYQYVQQRFPEVVIIMSKWSWEGLIDPTFYIRWDPSSPNEYYISCRYVNMSSRLYYTTDIIDHCALTKSCTKEKCEEIIDCITQTEILFV